MDHLKVDFLGGEAEQKSHRTTVILAVVFSVTVGLLAAVGAGASYRAASRGTSVFAEVGNLPIISDLRRLAWGDALTSDDDPTDNEQITFLLMGVGGTGHSGPQLSDTILLATADLKENKVGITSIPRDLAYPLGGGRFIKINAVNAYAEQSNPGNGAREAADAFEELLGIDIDHVIKIDFNAFVEFVDALGGLDIHVDRSFVDYEYPTEDDKWQTISFKEGDEHMDGARALIFARSRHGSNGEGSDFARSARQQKIIVAIKEKLLSMGTLTNPQKLISLYEAISSNVQTDITPWQLIKLAPLAKDISSDKITTTVLTNGEDGELVSDTVNGAYMLFPKEPDWSEIRAIVQHPFETKEELQTISAPKEPVALEIRNGTSITGYASRMSEYLKSEGYLIQGIGNAERRDYEKTVIFDLTKGAKPEELEAIRAELDANISPNLPEWTTNATTTDGEQKPSDMLQTDFLIVLGSETYNIIE